MRRTAPVCHGERQLNVAIDHEAHAAFDQLAALNGLSKADLLRFAVDYMLAHPELAAAAVPLPPRPRVVTVRALRDW